MVITPVITYYGAKVPGAVNFQRASIEDVLEDARHAGVRTIGAIVGPPDKAAPKDRAAH